MLKFKLDRTQKNERCIIGNLEVYNDDNLVFKCYTLENPNIGAERQKDLAIPEGVYTLDKRMSPKFSAKFANEKYPNGREMFWVYNDVIPKDAFILIHNGNYEKDTEGCILIGKSVAKSGTSPVDDMVTSSVDTVKELYKVIDSIYPTMWDLSGATITITNKF